VTKVGTSNPDRTISLKMLQCVVENNNNNNYSDILKVNSPGCMTIQTIYSCRLCDELCDRMTL
jgi:hypothetical protein